VLLWLWIWQQCALASLSEVSHPPQGAPRRDEGLGARPSDFNPGRHARGENIHTVATFDELSASVEGKEEVIALARDIPVASAISVSATMNLSSARADAFALDGQMMDQVLVVLDSGDVVLENIVIRNANAATNGSAIAVLGGSLQLIRCAILGSSSEASGGAVFVSNGSIRVTESNFYDNRAMEGGAVALYESTMTITNSKFRRNSAVLGGAVFVGAQSRLDVSGCIFANNLGTSFASRTSRGGAVYLSESVGSIRDTELSSNSANEGGAIASCVSSLSTTELTMVQNTANFGGAMALEQTHLSDERSHIRWNSAEVGGGLCLTSEAVFDASNSSVKDNVPDDVAESKTAWSRREDATVPQLRDDPPDAIASIAADRRSRELNELETLSPTYSTPEPTALPPLPGSSADPATGVASMKNKPQTPSLTSTPVPTASPTV